MESFCHVINLGVADLAKELQIPYGQNEGEDFAGEASSVS